MVIHCKSIKSGYRYSKIKEEEMNNVPHHLIDVIEPTQRYSAADFQHSGRQLITEIANRGHLS